MEEKLICTYSGPMRGDACSHSKYKPKKPMTVRELCDYAIQSDNWGTITVIDNGVLGCHKIDYYNHEYCDNSRNPKDLDFPEEILTAYVEHVDWDGGWGCGDWDLFLECEVEDQIKEEPPVLSKKERIEQRIKSMSKDELERYILEAKVRRIMMEEDI